jgi:hypothetical protein
LLRDPRGAWSLDIVIDGGHRCVEATVGGRITSSLLCDAPPTTRPIGDVAVLDAGQSQRLLVAVADPAVTRFEGYPREGGATSLDTAAVAVDPDHEQPTYLAGIVTAPGPTDLLILSPPHTLADLVLPTGVGSVAASSVELHTDGPYGRWPGYRKAGSTGYWYGGVQEVGFYDGPEGRTCALYRRFGRPEQLLADLCPSMPAEPGIADARLVVDDAASSALRLQPVLVVDGPATGWRCELSDGRACPINPLFLADPKGTGRAMGAPSISALDPASTDSVTFIATGRDGRELSRTTVPVPR